MVKLGSRQHRQREDIDLVRLLLQGKVEASAEPGVVVVGQSVDQVESVGNPGHGKLLQGLFHLPRFECTMQRFEDLRISRLQTDLDRAGKLCEQFRRLRIEKIGLGLKVIMDLRGLFDQQSQQLLAPFRRSIKGRIENPDLRNPLSDE